MLCFILKKNNVPKGVIVMPSLDIDDEITDNDMMISHGEIYENYPPPPRLQHSGHTRISYGSIFGRLPLQPTFQHTLINNGEITSSLSHDNSSTGQTDIDANDDMHIRC